jgi:hypothetical protein
MSAISKTTLILLSRDFKLGYKDSEEVQPQKNTLLAVAGLVICAVFWPAAFLFGSVSLALFLPEYVGLKWKQNKLVSLLTDENKLQAYDVEKRVKSLEERIKEFELSFVASMEKMLSSVHDKDNFILMVERELGFSGSLDLLNTNAELRKEFIQKFKKNFTQISNLIHPSTQHQAELLLKLEAMLEDWERFSLQKETLSSENEKLTSIRKVMQMSFIKNVFRIQRLDNLIQRSVIWLFPLGNFVDLYFNLSVPNDRLIYENNNRFIPPGIGLDQYSDLVEAHNGLISENQFLMPYFPPEGDLSKIFLMGDLVIWHSKYPRI